MSTSGEAAESSRAGQDAEPVAPQQRWVALLSTPRILPDARHERARAMGDDPNTTAELDLDDAPRPSNLVLHPRIAALGPSAAHEPSAYILAAERLGGLLFRVTKPRRDDPANMDEIMYLCSTGAHKALTLPAVPYSDLGIEAQPRGSVGLIDGPSEIGGHYLVALLCPRPPDTRKWFLKPLQHLTKLCLPPPSPPFRGDNMLCFSTVSHEWFLNPLHTTTAARMRNLCGETRALAHGGRLYWVNLAYGIFFCDPFAEPSDLRFVPLPDGCQVWEEKELSRYNRYNVALRRRVAPSEGHLRFVEIMGFSYNLAPDVQPRQPVNPRVRMWTLVDPEAAQPWRFEDELEARFDHVWLHPSYVDKRLPYMEVPNVALVDPDNHHIVYFLQGLLDAKLYGVDLRTREVVFCANCPVPVGDIIDAWEWSPPTPSPPEENENGERNLSRWVIQHVDSWLDRMAVAPDHVQWPSSSSE